MCMHAYTAFCSTAVAMRVFYIRVRARVSVSYLRVYYLYENEFKHCGFAFFITFLYSLHGSCVWCVAGSWHFKLILEIPVALPRSAVAGSPGD